MRALQAFLQNKTPWLYSSYAFTCCNLDAFDWQHEPLPWTLLPDVLTGIATKYLDVAKIWTPLAAILLQPIRIRQWGDRIWLGPDAEAIEVLDQSRNIAWWCWVWLWFNLMKLKSEFVQSSKLDLQVPLFKVFDLFRSCKRPSLLNPLQLAGVKPPCLPSHWDRKGLLVGCVLPHQTEDVGTDKTDHTHGNNTTKFREYRWCNNWLTGGQDQLS